jgi:peptide/nickel transport system substrate-binding protein
MLESVGIKVKLRLVDAPALAAIVVKRDFQAYVWSYLAGPDPLAALRCFSSKTPSTACNTAQFANPEFDKLIDAATLETVPARAIELMKKADGIIFDEAPMWFFSTNKAAMAVQPRVRGVQPNMIEMAWQYGEDMWVTEPPPAAK